MRLNLHTDYALRVLIYLAENQDHLCSIGEISNAYGISHNPMMKIVHTLVKGGHLSSVRGRNGGIQLTRPAGEITVGSIVRYMEVDLRMADCGSCVIGSACGLQGVLGQAANAFLGVLDATTFADLAHGPRRLSEIWLSPNAGLDLQAAQ